VNLSATNVPPLKLDGETISQLGQGTGMLGLPGDSTPPSRFVRAVAFTQSAVKPENAEEAVNMAFHIANNFDIPKGFSRDVENGQTFYDFTFWTTWSDLTNRAYYYRGYNNIKIFKADLNKLDFTASDRKQIDTSNSDWFTEVS
jgi:choloylglycine hydrolase